MFQPFNEYDDKEYYIWTLPDGQALIFSDDDILLLIDQDITHITVPFAYTYEYEN